MNKYTTSDNQLWYNAFIAVILGVSLFVIAISFWSISARLTNYEYRLNEYNAHVCAVYGKMPDCQTELP